MELSILVAKIFALYMLAVGVGVLSGKMNVYKMLKSFEDSQGLTLIAGLFSIIIGAILIQYHNIWVKDWTVLITLAGWTTLLKGVLIIACPQSLFYFKGMYKNIKPSLGLLPIIISLLIGYFLFVA